MRNSKRFGAELVNIRVLAERPPRVFAFGDIHGCCDELRAVLTYLKLEQRLTPEDQCVFIGDYIDRGPGSKSVIETLIQFKQEFPKTIFLRGNHEDMLLGFLGLGGHAGEVYLSNGGTEFFKSYGIEPTGPISAIVDQLPKPHLEFLTNLELAVCISEFLFVHAGIAPHSPLNEQMAHDLMWVRAEFIQSQHNLGKTVVFGHTPFEDVLLHLPYKIGIDTGLVYGNRLSVVELVQGTLFQVDRGDQEVLISALRDRLESGSD